MINILERAKEVFDRVQLHYIERATARKVGFFYIRGKMWIVVIFFKPKWCDCSNILFANLGRARMLENPQIRKMHLAKQP